ncbi:MAG: penicillin-binding protein 2 [Alphaproteobacteria bacterium]|nr:penicillin-binding protein 2 [Alphaproteobacteria bacterium]
MDLKVFSRTQPHSSVSPMSGELERTKSRLIILMIVFSLTFVVIGFRLGHLMISVSGDEQGLETALEAQGAVTRADILDRNGVVLATSLVTQSLYANPKVIMNPEEAARMLNKVFPDLSVQSLKAKLSSDRGFIWLKRNLTPAQQNQVYNLGIPGVWFQREEKRVYPHGRLFSHVLGCTDVDNKGVSGIEKSFDEGLLHDKDPLQLSLDTRLQHVVKDEILRKMEEFNAIGGMGIVMDVQTGEVLAMVSMPDYDPHHIGKAKKDDLFNNVTLGVFELGSNMKILTTALALESGAVNIDSRYDITGPYRIGRFKVKDYHPKNMVANIPQIFLHSSNVGMIKMINDVGVKTHQEFLRKFGLLSPALIELPEVAKPLLPKDWREVSSMTIAYGYGLAITPLQMANAIASVVNGGILRRPTLIMRKAGEVPTGVRVISEKTSYIMRDLLRLVVQHGTGRKAAVPGFDVGGKTGTAEKLSATGGYRNKDNRVSFVSAFPMKDPKYLVMVTIDEPRGNKSSFGFATAGWIAAPAAKNIVQRIAPLLRVCPVVVEEATSPQYEIFKASAQVE